MIKIKVSKNKNCPACNKNYEYLTGEKKTDYIKFCGTKNIQIKGKPINLINLKNKLEKISKVEDIGNCLVFQNMYIFSNGRILIKCQDINQAKILYSKYIGN